MKQFFLHYYILGLISLSCWVNSFAQDFEVAPVQLNFAVEPGGLESKTITVMNHSNKSQTFVLTLGDVARGNIDKSKPVPAGSSKRSCADWITMNPSFFELNPNGTIDIEVLMQVPSDGYSTRWARIYVRATQEQTPRAADKVVASGIIISPRIGINVIQSPKSNTKYKAIVSNFKEVTTAQDTVRTFTVSVDNIGDKILNCKTYLVISNLETAKERKLNPINVNVYPDESRAVTLKLPQDLEPGTYSLAAIVDYGHRTNLEAVQLQIEVD
ncbi:MAG: hypothetical protein ABII90_12360 [Bacteroidota bacterium]